MTFKNRLYNSLSALLPNNAVFAEYYKRSSEGKKADWTRQANTLNAKEIKDWKSGVMAATDPENPRRGDLMRFYQALLLDNHLASVIDTRILKVQRSSFRLIDDKGNENDELYSLLERPWFEDLVRLVLLSRFQGTTLIELFDLDPETMELARVDEIPQSNFLPLKGLIIKEEYDDNGADYRTGAFADYYFQVGGDWDLGMLNQLAMIVLAKKLGLGSWMSYVDKYGVPPIFFITDRMDTGRRDELFEMGKAFRQNMFAVLQGNEKIEVPRISETNPHQVFLSLINDVCNKEISKRVLGGTASTDEKAFVGSAEVQERVAQDRYEADKLLFKYIFNTKIRPRLVKISPIYKDFEKFTLEWDNQETLDIKGYIDAVSKLSGAFEFDVEEIKTRTGLPVTAVKSLAIAGNEPQPPQDPEPPKKKRPDASAGFRYAPFAITHAAPPMAATWDAAIEQLVNQIWEGKAKPADLNRDLVLKYYAGLSKATQNGWGGGYYTNELTRQFRENLLKFSGAKSYNLIQQIADLHKGKVAKEIFVEQAKKLVNAHNETWQAVEEKFAANSASSARDFQAYQQDADLYPNLKFRTMGDSNVRPEHAANEGVIKPINQWTKIPPLDCGCRCWLEQTTEKANGKDISVYNDKIANNAALNGQLFTEKNSYFQNIPASDKQIIRENTDLMKEYAPYNRQIKAGGNTVFVNDFAHLDDLQPNIDAAKIVAEFLKKDIYIRPHIDIAEGHPNPEFYIGRSKNIADLKTMQEDSKNFFKSRITSANTQGCKDVVMNISAYKGNASDLSGKILEGFYNKYKGDAPYNFNIKRLIIIRGDKVIQLTRKQVEKGIFRDLEKLN
ncbi:MAG: DUF935 family protein [Prevotellaceae bacterium]|jgi:hypothetical protein|nr:DUF935 family protein [Prevotellaceae bacterium]